MRFVFTTDNPTGKSGPSYLKLGSFCWFFFKLLFLINRQYLYPKSPHDKTVHSLLAFLSLSYLDCVPYVRFRKKNSPLSMRSHDMWHSFRQRIHAEKWRGLFDFSFLLWNMPFLLSNFILWESPSYFTNQSIFQSEDIFLQSMWIKETFMSQWGVRNMGQMYFIQ